MSRIKTVHLHQPVAGNMYELLGHIPNLLITFVDSYGFRSGIISQLRLQKRLSISTNDNPSPGAEQYRSEPHQHEGLNPFLDLKIICVPPRIAHNTINQF